MLAGMTWEPRAAINDIEQEIGLLRDRIAEREQVLVEAIDQHANLSKEAVRGMGVVRQAVAQIRDAFNVAMRPIPCSMTRPGQRIQGATTGEHDQFWKASFGSRRPLVSGEWVIGRMMKIPRRARRLS